MIQSFLPLELIKKRPKASALRRVKYTRGTTQIATLWLPPLRAPSSPMRSRSIHGSPYSPLMFQAFNSEVIGLRNSCCRFAASTGSLKASVPTIFVIVFKKYELIDCYIITVFWFCQAKVFFFQKSCREKRSLPAKAGRRHRKNRMRSIDYPHDGHGASFNIHMVQ